MVPLLPAARQAASGEPINPAFTQKISKYIFIFFFQTGSERVRQLSHLLLHGHGLPKHLQEPLRMQQAAVGKEAHSAFPYSDTSSLSNAQNVVRCVFFFPLLQIDPLPLHEPDQRDNFIKEEGQFFEPASGFMALETRFCRNSKEAN